MEKKIILFLTKRKDVGRVKRREKDEYSRHNEKNKIKAGCQFKVDNLIGSFVNNEERNFAKVES